MADNANSILLGAIPRVLIGKRQEEHLRSRLKLKYIKGFEAEDTVLGSRDVSLLPDDVVVLRGVRRDELTVEFVIDGALHGDPLIDEYRQKVTEALASLPA